jgi:hypothetical protein
MRALTKNSVPVMVVLVLIAGVSARAQAQMKPFKITGGGPAPDGISLIPGVPAIHYPTGQATELGRYSWVGMLRLLPDRHRTGRVLDSPAGSIPGGGTGPSFGARPDGETRARSTTS